MISLLLALHLAASWTPQQAAKIVTVSNVVVSPDGKNAAWLEGRPNPDPEKTDNLNQIVCNKIVLTRGDSSAVNPEWAPDNKTIYFLRANAIWRINIEGGEAEKFLSFEGTIKTYHLSPDGKTIAFVASEKDAESEKARHEKLDFKEIDKPVRHPALYIAGKKLYDPAYEIGTFTWSPDSRSIAFDHQPAPGIDLALTTDIGEIQIETGTVKDIANTSATERAPQYSPDGRYIAFVKSTPKPTWIGEGHVAVYERATAKMFDLPPTDEAEPSLIGWTDDSKRVLFTEPHKTQLALYSQPLDGPAKLEVLPEKGIARGFTARHAYVLESFDSAPEAYVRGTKVSDANTQLPKLTDSKMIKWKSKDGREIEGILHLPLNAKSPMPLVVSVHGGPQGVYAQDYPGRGFPIPTASLTAQGYAVFMPNFRGSVGYGRAFRWADKGDWGGGDWRDIESGVDSLIAQGIADPKHMALLGWSYGGYMAMWGPTQTNRYVVSIAGAGMSNLISQIGVSDMTYDISETYDAEHWENAKPFIAQSPLNFIKNVKTPVLLLHGESDVRDPIGESQQYYNALKRLGIKTELATFPRQPHGIQERKLRVQLMEKILEWLNRYMIPS